MLKREAAAEALAEAKAVAAAKPGDDAAQAAADHAAKVHEAVDERTKTAEANRSSSTPCVAPSDPEAVVQPLKNLNTSRPSYKPSILADEDKLIVGQHVHGSNEAASIQPILEQHEHIYGEMPPQVSADNGYNAVGPLQTLGEAGVDALVAVRPDKPKKAEGSEHEGAKKFGKPDFKYDAAEDGYWCPANKLLRPGARDQDHGHSYTKYRTPDCRDCPLRAKCTDSSRGREIKRYDGEELKEAMVEIMKHPEAKRKFARRRVMVEPVFGDLRDHQNLKRFRRRGKKRVATEFAIHCVAYNIRRTHSLLKARRAVAVAVFARSPGSCWRLVALAVHLD
jgi:hypothetical protein